MNFGLTEEQELLRNTSRDFLAEHAAIKSVREVMDGPESSDAGLWRRMAELGWTGLAMPESVGGSGLGMVELTLLVEELGRCLAPVPFLPTAIASTAILEMGTGAQQAQWLAPICAGESVATLAITEEKGSEAPADLALSARRTGDGWELSGRKLFVPDADVADLLLVLARTGGEGERGLALFAVPRTAPGVRVEALHSMDLLRRLHEVELDGVRVPSAALLGDNDDAWPDLRRCLDRALVVIAGEMVGGAEKCLEDSVAYAKERVQFGKPIGVNQAIKHKCADMLFEVESARSITYYAAWAASEANDEAELTAAMAKAYAGDAYRKASAENIQIHGGVGFTWEYNCHLYFKRATADAAWLGDATLHRERVAQLLKI